MSLSLEPSEMGPQPRDIYLYESLGIDFYEALFTTSRGVYNFVGLPPPVPDSAYEASDLESLSLWGLSL